MKNKYIKLTLEIVGLQIFFSVLALFFMPFFSWMDNWELIFTILTTWLFLGAIHSTFWQLGRKDKKNNIILNNHLSENQPAITLSLLGGLKMGSAAFILNIFIVLIAYLVPSGKFSDILYNIHRILIGPMFGFLPSYTSSSYWIVTVLLCFLIYVTGIIAYISGVYNFSISEKIVPKIIYKSKSKQD